MAALRCAARKLVGLRPRAAALSAPLQAGHRRFLPRLIHSGRPAGAAHPATHPPNGTTEAHIIQRELRMKKEEVYNLLAEVERNRYYTDSGAGVLRERYENIRLLRHLSVQVDPKPNDSKWRFYQITHKFLFYSVYWAYFITGYSINSMFHADKGGEEAPKGKKIALGGRSAVGEQKAHSTK